MNSKRQSNDILIRIPIWQPHLVLQYALRKRLPRNSLTRRRTDLQTRHDGPNGRHRRQLLLVKPPSIRSNLGDHGSLERTVVGASRIPRTVQWLSSWYSHVRYIGGLPVWTRCVRPDQPIGSGAIGETNPLFGCHICRRHAAILADRAAQSSVALTDGLEPFLIFALILIFVLGLKRGFPMVGLLYGAVFTTFTLVIALNIFFPLA